MPSLEVVQVVQEEGFFLVEPRENEKKKLTRTVEALPYFFWGGRKI